MKRYSGTALRCAGCVAGGALAGVLWLFPAWGRGDNYQVRPGDTLSSISKQFEVTPQQLAAYNHLSNPDRLDIGQQLSIPTGSGQAKRTYVVKKGDVLGAIAQDHQVSVQALVDLNRLTSPDRLDIGEELLIPSPVTPSVQPSSLPAELRHRLNAIRVPQRRWRYIVIHHSGTDRGTMKGLDRYHREDRGMENGLAYHFVIGNGSGIPDGEIELTDRWRRQLDGGHMASAKLNRQCIGICLIGNFDQTTPTRRQMESLLGLCDYLTRQCRLSKYRIKGHQQINTKPTRCPGEHFPLNDVLSRLPG